MSNIKWQHVAHARRKLWNLVMGRFAEPSRPYQVTISRDDLLDAGVIGYDFDTSGRPVVFVSKRTESLSAQPERAEGAR